MPDRVSERALWVDLGAGTLEPTWVYMMVRYRNGRADFGVRPRWATERDVRPRAYNRAMTTPKFRIPADDDYLLALGRAVYNFAYMEAGFVWAIRRLGDRTTTGLPFHETGATMEAKFRKAVKTTKLALPAKLRAELLDLAAEFGDAVDDRNNLLHATPFTAKGGAQRLSGKGHRQWMTRDLYAAAKRFEELSLKSGDPLRDELEKLSPKA